MGSSVTPEDILWKAHDLGIKEAVYEELSRIKSDYPNDLNAAYTQAFANVTESKAEDKQKRNGDHAI